MPSKYIAGTRSISSDIIGDRRVNTLSNPWWIIGQFRVILQMDNLGRLEADEHLIKAMIFPRNPQVTIEQCKQFVEDLHNSGLCFLYVNSGDLFLQSPSFWRQQMSGHMERKSTLPPPDPDQFLKWLTDVRKDKRFQNIDDTNYHQHLQRVISLLSTSNPDINTSSQVLVNDMSSTCNVHVNNKSSSSNGHGHDMSRRSEAKGSEAKGSEAKGFQGKHRRQKPIPDQSLLNRVSLPAEKSMVFDFCESHFCHVTTSIERSIIQFLQSEPPEMIIDAIQLAIESGHKHDWNDVETVITRRQAKRSRMLCPICGQPKPQCTCANE